MYLSRFGVKNYKCLGEIDIPLTPIHVLIGQNDCGKTSLLEAIYAFCASAGEHIKNFGDVLPKPWAGRELVRHAHPEPKIELWGAWVELARGNEISRPLKYGRKLDVTFMDAVRPVRQWVTLDKNGQPIETLMTIADKESTRINNWLKKVQKYSFDAKVMAVPAVIDPARRFQLDIDGFGLATLLDDILGFDPEIFLDLRKEFCGYFPQFRSLSVQTEQAKQRVYSSSVDTPNMDTGNGKGIYFETQSGATVRARHASDGAILFLGFLALAHLPEPPNLLLIEEPENGVYPKRLGQVIELLKQMVYRTEGVRFPQIIMTTHSPYVLSHFEPEEVTLLSRPSEPADAPVRARPLRDAPNIRERLGSEFYLGELWYNLSEEDLFGGA
jgi:hypothetical protein